VREDLDAGDLAVRADADHDADRAAVALGGGGVDAADDAAVCVKRGAVCKGLVGLLFLF